MDESTIVKLATLRSKLASIPGKLLVAFLLFFATYCNFNFDKFTETPVNSIFTMVAMYGIVSYFWLCVRAAGNWLIGIVTAIILIVIWTVCMNKLPPIFRALIGAAICFGGVVMDILHIFNYFRIKKKVRYAHREYYSREQDTAWESEEDEEDEEYEEYEEEDFDDEEYGYEEEIEEPSRESSPGFFTGCGDQSSIRRRYRDLCRVYHPDSGNGSAEIFNRITEEYNRLTARAGQ